MKVYLIAAAALLVFAPSHLVLVMALLIAWRTTTRRGSFR